MPISFRLLQRRTVWAPTLLGWIGLAIGALGSVVGWGLGGESFLRLTRRVPADVLVVEGWIGRPGIAAAKAEFERGRYRWIVTAGGLSKSDWDNHRWNYAIGARDELVRLGVPEELVLAAASTDVTRQRTFESAIAVEVALAARGIRPAGVNVLTAGVHSRRSRLVYAKVLSNVTSQVGAIAWIPEDQSSGAWWTSSERSAALLKESVGWIFELLLNSGRWSNHPASARRNA